MAGKIEGQNSYKIMKIKTSCLLLFCCLLFLFASQAAGISGLLNINTATEKELQELPYIGEKKAKAIIHYRSRHESFERLEDLLEVTEIGPKSFEAIKPYLILTGVTSLKSEQDGKNTSRLRKKIITQPGQIRILPDKEYYDTLTSLIQHARHRIDLAMFVFKTTKSPKNRPALLVNELIRARAKRVEVNVVLEKSGYADNINKENKKVAQKLRKNGIKVRFDGTKTTSHAKMVVVDSRYCLVGSHNFTHSALAYNNEFSLLIDSTVLAGEMLRYMDTIR